MKGAHKHVVKVKDKVYTYWSCNIQEVTYIDGKRKVKTIYIGNFSTPEKAHQAYKEAIKKQRNDTSS